VPSFTPSVSRSAPPGFVLHRKYTVALYVFPIVKPPTLRFIPPFPRLLPLYHFRHPFPSCCPSFTSSPFADVAPPPPLEIQTPRLEGTYLGTQYAKQIQLSESGGSYNWSVVSGELPNGLTLNSATGEITGLAAYPYDFDFRIRVEDTSDPNRNDEQDYAIRAGSTLTQIENRGLNGTYNIVEGDYIADGWRKYSWPGEEGPSLQKETFSHTREGDASQKLEDMSVWHGGICQTVPVEVGKKVSFSVAAKIYRNESTGIPVDIGIGVANGYTDDPTQILVQDIRSDETEDLTEWKTYTVTLDNPSVSEVTVFLIGNNRFANNVNVYFDAQPRIEAATHPEENYIYLRFSEKMDKTTAETISNYTISGGLTVVGAELDGSKKIVELELSGTPTDELDVVVANGIMNEANLIGIGNVVKVIKEGNTQGIIGAEVQPITTGTDHNYSTICNGIGTKVRIEVPGEQVKQVYVNQTKAAPDGGEVYFGETGEATEITVTSSGGNPNVAEVVVRQKTVGASLFDFSIQAWLGSVFLGKRELTSHSVEVDGPSVYYACDDRPIKIPVNVSPEPAGNVKLSILGIDGISRGIKSLSTSTVGSRVVATFGPEFIGKKFGFIQFDQSGGAAVDGSDEQKVAIVRLTHRPVIGMSMDLAGGGTASYDAGTWMDYYANHRSSSISVDSEKMVDRVDGTVKLQYTDLAIKGRGGLNYEFIRTYRGNNSRKRYRVHRWNPERSNKPRPYYEQWDFGENWYYTYADDRLIIADDVLADAGISGGGEVQGVLPYDSASYLWYRDDGSSMLFKVDGQTGTWTANDGGFARLHARGSGNEMHIVESNGTVRIYHGFTDDLYDPADISLNQEPPSRNGRLKKIIDRNGNELNFEYGLIDPENNNKTVPVKKVSGSWQYGPRWQKYVLKKVTDVYGREIRYKYYVSDANQSGDGTESWMLEETADGGKWGRLAWVEDFSGRKLYFNYSGSGNLKSASGPEIIGTSTGNDVSYETYAGSGDYVGRTWVYNYFEHRIDDPGFPTTSQWENMYPGVNKTKTVADAVYRENQIAFPLAKKTWLRHKLTDVWTPNQVKGYLNVGMASLEDVLGKATHRFTYDYDVYGGSDDESWEVPSKEGLFGWVETHEYGTSESGSDDEVRSGGTVNYSWEDLNEAINWGDYNKNDEAFDYDKYMNHSATITNTNGDVTKEVYCAAGVAVTTITYTNRNLRGDQPGDEPDEYRTETTLHEYLYDDEHADYELRSLNPLVKKVKEPRGNFQITYYDDDVVDTYIHNRANIVRVVRDRGPVGGEQSQIEVVKIYDPVFNNIHIDVDPRGVDANYTPPIPDVVDRKIADPFVGGRQLDLRYATINYFDYQENSDLAESCTDSKVVSLWSAIPTAVRTALQNEQITAVQLLLLDRLYELPRELYPEWLTGEGNRENYTSNVAVSNLNKLKSVLARNYIELGLGDLNGDGEDDVSVSGNIIRTTYGGPVLRDKSFQHRIEDGIETAGDLIDSDATLTNGGAQESAGGTSYADRIQTIVEMFQFNENGLVWKYIDPEGNGNVFYYYPNSTPYEGGLDPNSGGHLARKFSDAAVGYYAQDGTHLLRDTATFPNNNTAQD